MFKGFFISPSLSFISSFSMSCIVKFVGLIILEIKALSTHFSEIIPRQFTILKLELSIKHLFRHIIDNLSPSKL